MLPGYGQLKIPGSVANVRKYIIAITCGRIRDRSGSFFGTVGVNSDCSFVSPPPSPRMDRKRERYNTKARQSVAGGASHKKRRRRGVKGPTGGDAVGAPIEVLVDPNAEIIGLKPLEQKELERRERIRQQVRTRLCLREYPRRSNPVIG